MKGLIHVKKTQVKRPNLREKILVFLMDSSSWVLSREMIKEFGIPEGTCFSILLKLKNGGFAESDRMKGYRITERGRRRAMDFLADNPNGIAIEKAPTVLKLTESEQERFKPRESIVFNKMQEVKAVKKPEPEDQNAEEKPKGIPLDDVNLPQEIHDRGVDWEREYVKIVDKLVEVLISVVTSKLPK